MSQLEQQQNINRSLLHVRPSNKSGSHLNCIRLRNNVLDGRYDKHNLEIVKRCMEYLKLGIPFMTEVIFVDGQRADILKPATGEIEEIAVTEKEESLERKKANYPFPIRVIRVR